MRRHIEFASVFDGSTRSAILVAPDYVGERPIPLIIVLHAAGYTAEFTAGYWRDLPIRRGVMAVFPFGHGRKKDLYSVGWRGQIADLAAMPHILDSMHYSVDRERVYAVGISMGGQEALLLAGKHPDMLAGVASFNAVADLGSWFNDYLHAPGMVLEEVGGTPDELPEEYAERSPISYTRTIARVPTLVYWDPDDDIVRYQEQKQCGLLFRRIVDAYPDAPITGRAHRRGHRWISPVLAVDWLLNCTSGDMSAEVCQLE